MNPDEQKAFDQLAADKDEYKKLTGQLGDILKRETVLAQAAGQSLEVKQQAQRMTFKDGLDASHKMLIIIGMLVGFLAYCFKLNFDTANNSRDIDDIRKKYDTLSKEFYDYKYSQALTPQRRTSP